MLNIEVNVLFFFCGIATDFRLYCGRQQQSFPAVVKTAMSGVVPVMKFLFHDCLPKVNKCLITSCRLGFFMALSRGQTEAHKTT